MCLNLLHAEIPANIHSHICFQNQGGMWKRSLCLVWCTMLIYWANVWRSRSLAMENTLVPWNKIRKTPRCLFHIPINRLNTYYGWHHWRPVDSIDVAVACSCFLILSVRIFWDVSVCFLSAPIWEHATAATGEMRREKVYDFNHQAFEGSGVKKLKRGVPR